MYAISRYMYTDSGNKVHVLITGQTKAEVKQQVQAAFIYSLRNLLVYILIGCIAFPFFNAHWQGSSYSQVVANLTLTTLIFGLSEADEAIAGVYIWLRTLTQFESQVTEVT